MNPISRYEAQFYPLLTDPNLEEDRAEIILNMPLHILADPVKRIECLVKQLLELQTKMNKTRTIN